MNLGKLAAGGSMLAGILSSACCIGPLAFGLLGISGAAAAHAFEPLRPYLLALTFGLLGAAFHSSYSRSADCGPGKACEMPGSRRLARLTLWLAAVVVVLATTFPYYAEYLPL